MNLTFFYQLLVSCGEFYTTQEWKNPTDDVNNHVLTKNEGSGETEGLTFYYGSKFYDMTSKGNDILKVYSRTRIRTPEK